MRVSTLRDSQLGFVHEVVLHELPRGRYRVEYLGKVLIEAGDDPTFDACRALLARGVTGRMQTRHASSPHASLRLSIEWGAARRSNENARRFAKWEDPAQIVSRCRRGSGKMGFRPRRTQAAKPSLSLPSLSPLPLSQGGRANDSELA